MAKKVTQADVDRLERQLSDDQQVERDAVARRKKAERSEANAREQVFETRKALIRAINELNTKRK